MTCGEELTNYSILVLRRIKDDKTVKRERENSLATEGRRRRVLRVSPGVTGFLLWEVIIEG